MKTAMQSKFMQMLAAAVVFAISGVVLVAQQPSPDAGQASGQAAAPAPGARTDGQIEMDVVQALDGSAALKNDLITAATIQGKVTLAGTVASDADKRLAESVVAKVPGVIGVKNNLNVGNPADDANAAGMPEDNTAPPVADEQQPPASQGQQPNPGNQGYPQQGQQAPPPPAQGQNYPQRPPYSQPQSGQQPAYPPPPPGYGQGYPPPPPGYARPNMAPRYTTPTGPMTVPAGTVLQLRTNDAVGEKGAKDGQPVDFTVIRDVAINGYLAIPRGATVHGEITEVKHAGQLTGAPELALKVTALDIDGRTYPLDSDQFKVRGPNKTAHTVGNAVGGALIGAIIGDVAGGGRGAAIGAVAGGGAGTAVSAAGSPHVWIPGEALVVFHLNSPVTVDPTSREVAMRLAQGLYQGGPTLYRRPAYYGPGYYGPTYYNGPAGPGYYAYPPIYYRPYIYAGGGYYWR
jgi:hypothetical protein